MYYAHIIRQYFKLNFYEVSKSIPVSTEVASHPLFIIFFLMGKLSLTRNWGQKKKKEAKPRDVWTAACLSTSSFLSLYLMKQKQTLFLEADRGYTANGITGTAAWGHMAAKVSAQEPGTGFNILGQVSAWLSLMGCWHLKEGTGRGMENVALGEGLFQSRCNQNMRLRQKTSRDWIRKDMPRITKENLIHCLL